MACCGVCVPASGCENNVHVGVKHPPENMSTPCGLSLGRVRAPGVVVTRRRARTGGAGGNEVGRREVVVAGVGMGQGVGECGGEAGSPPQGRWWQAGSERVDHREKGEPVVEWCWKRVRFWTGARRSVARGNASSASNVVSHKPRYENAAMPPGGMCTMGRAQCRHGR